MGTQLKQHEFSLPVVWNRRGTLGTGPHDCFLDCFPRHQFWFYASAPCVTEPLNLYD